MMIGDAVDGEGGVRSDKADGGCAKIVGLGAVWNLGGVAGLYLDDDSRMTARDLSFDRPDRKSSCREGSLARRTPFGAG
jgi:hypothetical protein